MGLVLSTECAVIRLIRCASFKPLECSCTQSASTVLLYYPLLGMLILISVMLIFSLCTFPW